MVTSSFIGLVHHHHDREQIRHGAGAVPESFAPRSAGNEQRAEAGLAWALKPQIPLLVTLFLQQGHTS